MKNCELCKRQATAFCESDRASLCWSCDAKVHGANFLVARHSRTLLCHSCQCPTPWKASGAKLGNTFSLCETCKGRLRGEESHSGNEDDVSTDDDVNDDGDSADFDVRRNDAISDNDGDDEDDDDEVDSDDDDGENQVVPFSISSPPPPPASSSSSDESVYEFSNNDGDFFQSVSVFSLKRMRENASDLSPQEDDLRFSSRYGSKFIDDVVVESRTGGEATCHESWRPFKDRRIGPSRTSMKSLCENKVVENLKEGERNEDSLDEEAV